MQDRSYSHFDYQASKSIVNSELLRGGPAIPLVTRVWSLSPERRATIRFLTTSDSPSERTSI